LSEREREKNFIMGDRDDVRDDLIVAGVGLGRILSMCMNGEELEQRARERNVMLCTIKTSSLYHLLV
jgi:hypothetical protein